MTARKTAHDLSPVDRQSPQWQTIVDSAGKHSWWVLLLVGATTCLFFGVVGTNVTTAEPVNPWDWHWWSYDVYWHRATTVLSNWWTGCLYYVIVAESRRLSHRSDGIESIDLLDLLPYQPLTRLGLTNALHLRRADGSFLQVLTQANTKALEELRWSAPEEFVVKADDGEADLYGVLYKPFDFDPAKKYPVIDAINGAPTTSILPKTFAFKQHGELWGAHAALAQLGCIVVIVDARGTPGRSKQFHDVAYANLGRHEIPDHVATLMQLADKRPYMDLSRVGIVGSSVGGYLVTRAMLMAPDVYHVGIATAQDSDMHIFGAYMESPTKNKAAWEYASNVWLADRLKGKLLLIHGTSDSEAPISHTMKMVDAFARANKPYDLLILPDQGHSLHRSEHALYWRAAHRRYLQEHLLRTRPQP